MGASAGVEKKSFGYGADCFDAAKLHAAAFAEDEAHDFSARPHDLITLLASAVSPLLSRVSSASNPIFQDSRSAAAGAWEQPRFGDAGSRLQLPEPDDHDHHEHDADQEHDQSEGFPRSEGGRRKELRRAWREEWKSKHRWVYPIRNPDGELRLKCTSCSLYNLDNVFAREGCSTIQMSALTTHAKSEAHKAAESRISAAGETPGGIAVHDGLIDGSKNGGEHASSLTSMSMQQQQHMDGGENPAGRKRKLTPVVSKGETLASVIQKNNSRVVQLLHDAESGRNSRHATNVGLAKKQIKLEEQRLQVERHLLEQDKARFNAHVSLGQSFIAALTDIGEGLKRIGNAMEARKTAL